MPTETLEQFFAGKSFEVPAYQRDYAWTARNIDDLFEDIGEALQTQSTHYIGTFILSGTTELGHYKIVDGQQRLTSITMLINALVSNLPGDEDSRRNFYTHQFLRGFSNDWKLSLLGNNQQFLSELLGGRNPKYCTRSQKRLYDAYTWITQRVAELGRQQGPGVLIQWLTLIGKLEVLEFIESDEGKAIRMFQSINDRGVLLSNMDKAKSCLIYYSNRFLGQVLDNHINQRFGECFRDYNVVKEMASEPGFEVPQINRETFSEDDILRYHYLAFDATQYDRKAGFDFRATSDYVLNDFLKGTLKRLRDDRQQLRDFVGRYVDDLAVFFQALRRLVEETRTDEATFKVFCILNISATLYPLIIRMRARGLLDEIVHGHPVHCLRDLIECADIRVYKTRGTDPARDVYELARRSGFATVQEIVEALRNFVRRFMDDALFRVKLREEIYANAGLNRMLTEFEISRHPHRPTIHELAEMMRNQQTIEHILPQTPEFGFPSHGFEDREEYGLANHRLGNLTLLEKALNGRCQNRSVRDKMNQPNLYHATDYVMTQELAAAGMNRGGIFDRTHMEQANGRTCGLLHEELVSVAPRCRRVPPYRVKDIITY